MDDVRTASLQFGGDYGNHLRAIEDEYLASNPEEEEKEMVQWLFAFCYSSISYPPARATWSTGPKQE